MLSRLIRHGARRVATPVVGALRNLHVHEYLSMEIMQEQGIATPEGYVARTPEEAENIFKSSFQKGTWEVSVAVFLNAPARSHHTSNASRHYRW